MVDPFVRRKRSNYQSRWLRAVRAILIGIRYSERIRPARPTFMLLRGVGLSLPEDTCSILDYPAKSKRFLGWVEWRLNARWLRRVLRSEAHAAHLHAPSYGRRRWHFYNLYVSVFGDKYYIAPAHVSASLRDRTIMQLYVHEHKTYTYTHTITHAPRRAAMIYIYTYTQIHTDA